MSTVPMAATRQALSALQGSRVDPALWFAPNLLQPARHEFAQLEEGLSSAHALQLPLHQIEQQQEPKGREVQRLLLQAHIQQRGPGDVGPALCLRQGAEEVRYTHRRIRPRSLKTIFGSVTVARMSYSRAGGDSICPLDAVLQLPARLFSYELQKRSVKEAVKGPFQESVEGIEENTGVSIPQRSLAEVLLDAAQDFDAFYREHTRGPDSGSLLVAAVDGKGIPMVKPAGAQRRVRPRKGEKTNRKRMATVATVFTRIPWVRTPEQVVQSLFRTSGFISMHLRSTPIRACFELPLRRASSKCFCESFSGCSETLKHHASNSVIMPLTLKNQSQRISGRISPVRVQVPVLGWRATVS